MTDRAPCVRCGRILHTGEGRVLISFTPDQLVELISSTIDLGTRAQLLCALSLVDAEKAKELA